MEPSRDKFKIRHAHSDDFMAFAGIYRKSRLAAYTQDCFLKKQSGKSIQEESRMPPDAVRSISRMAFSCIAGESSRRAFAVRELFSVGFDQIVL